MTPLRVKSALNFFAIMAGILIPTFTPALGADDKLPDKITFQVLDLKSGKELFSGYELIKVQGETIVKDTYYETQEKRLAQFEKVEYDRTSLALLKYTLDNKLTGENAEVNLESGKFNITYRAPNSSATAVTNSKLESVKERYLGKVLHHLIVRNWVSLISRKALSFDLIVPFKLDAYRFQVVKERTEANLTAFRLQPDSWLIRKFVEPMDFYYSDAPQKRLVKYLGPTTINTKENDESKVQINFFYEN